MAKKNTIRCPHCGCEYLPGELYLPKDFLGQPNEVFRDEKGVILGYNGTDMDTCETFNCWQCGKDFSIDAVVTFKTAPINDPFKDDEDFADIIKKEK